MARPFDTVYTDPEAAGSLSRLLRLWRKLSPAQRRSDATRVIFTLSCPGEARAIRVAGFLRRRLACHQANVHHVAGARRDTWHVHGSLHPAAHSLADLEEIWSWIAQSADRHQVSLVRVGLALTGA